MESRAEVAEGFVIAIALLIFLSYHIWAFFLAGQGCLTTTDDSYGINGKGRLARVVFTSAVCAGPKTPILGVQASRNGMMGVSFQASITALFLNVLIELLLDAPHMTYIGTFARHDPLLRDTPTPEPAAPPVEPGDQQIPMVGVVSVRTIVVINICILLVAMMLFIVCIRLYVHMGYFYGAAVDRTQSWVNVQDALELTLQTQMIYTTGQRTMFLFPITILWLLGPLAMLCASIIITAVIAAIDRWDPKWATNYEAVLEHIQSSQFYNAHSTRRKSQRW